MKKHVLILSITIALVGYMVFGSIKKEPVVVSYDLTSCSTNDIVSILEMGFSDKEEETVIKEEDLFYSVGSRSTQVITLEKLRNAQTLQDIILEYPDNWVGDYDLVESYVNRDGNIIKEIGRNNILTRDQKNLLNTIKMSDVLVFKIKYKAKNAVSNQFDVREMTVSMKVVPEVQAEYKDGYKKLISYIKANSAYGIIGKSMEDLQFTRLSFVVNAIGGIEQVNIVDSSGDSEVDTLLVNAISNMKKWIPAKNKEGKAISQKLEFILTYGDNC